jgi:hypothetical protein
VADFVVVEGLKPWDGTYPLDIDEAPLTTREWGWIKRLTGYLPADFTLNDPEVICALAVVAMHRAGRVTTVEVPATFERIVDAPFGPTIRLEATDEAGDADDPPHPAGATGSNATSSGNGLAPSSETSGPARSSTGIPASASSVSDPETLVT